METLRRIPQIRLSTDGDFDEKISARHRAKRVFKKPSGQRFNAGDFEPEFFPGKFRCKAIDFVLQPASS
jgi:hypothetical protein